MASYKIIGSIRHGTETYQDVLKDGHGIPESRIESLKAGGFLEEIEYVTKPKRKAHAAASKGKWDFDPDGLKALSLERLNTMIAENGGKEKFETTEEAIAFLSSDYSDPVEE